MMTALFGTNVPTPIGVVDRHQRLDARAERAVVLLAEVVRAEIRALVDQVLDDRYVSPMLAATISGVMP